MEIFNEISLLECNKLIAEYMGIEVRGTEADEFWTEDHDYHSSWETLINVIEKIVYDDHKVELDWDVGVCLKCKITGYKNEDEIIHIIEKDLSTMMESTYDAIVRHILLLKNS